MKCHSLQELPLWIVFFGLVASSASAQEDHSKHQSTEQPKQADHSKHASMPESPAMSPAEHMDHSRNRGKVTLMPSDCGAMEVWDSISAMCLPYPTGMDMTHLMVHGNIFGVGIVQSGPRGEDAVVSTQMLMGNFGKTAGERHFLNVNLMLTAEKWTLPAKGYPLLLQTGEANRSGAPYVDAQHPHTSPIMGLTLSDTIRLGEGKDYKDFLKFSFAPRGQSTDGPITFMHRPTGAVNPDAPLGHHIGQDLGHITSTVFAGTLRLGKTQFELSAFNGTEPEPDEVNLPLGSPNSGAARLTYYFTDNFLAMASIAYIKDPHPHSDGGAPPSYDEGVKHAVRHSLSAYLKHRIWEDGSWYHTLIHGTTQTFGVDTLRHSFAYESALQKNGSTGFGRVEVLHRIPAELLLSSLPMQLDSRWVAALTLGYSHKIMDLDSVKMNLGISGTHFHLPKEFHDSYGGNPWAGKVFLQVSGMDMWNG